MFSAKGRRTPDQTYPQVQAQSGQAGQNPQQLANVCIRPCTGLRYLSRCIHEQKLDTNEVMSKLKKHVDNTDSLDLSDLGLLVEAKDL